MQKNTVFQTLMASMMAVFASLMMTSQALAHPGHDHHANESMLLHVLFYGSIVAAVAACAWFGYSYFKKQNNK